MIQRFLSTKRSSAIAAICNRAVILVWAIACGSSVYHGAWLDGFTFFIGGLLLLSIVNEVEAAREYFDSMEDGNDVFLKAVEKGDAGIMVIAAGTLEDIIKCSAATSKFTAKALAESDEDEDTAADYFKDVFKAAVDAYCEDKGIDKDDFFKRVGLDRMD